MSSGPPGDDQQGQQPSWQQPQQPQWQQPQQQQPQWGQGGGGGFQPQTTPGSATAALILGICALLVCPIICAPLALVYGNRARNEIDSSGGRLGGRGMATAGIVLGWIGIAWAVLWIIYIIAVAASA
jgi:hypothetical protein